MQHLYCVGIRRSGVVLSARTKYSTLYGASPNTSSVPLTRMVPALSPKQLHSMHTHPSNYKTPIAKRRSCSFY